MQSFFKKLVNNKNTLINAGLFQMLWLSAVLGSANNLIWPCLIIFALLACWQLHPQRRATKDIYLVVIAIFIGLIIDSLWVVIGVIEYTDKRPIDVIAPLWIVTLWAGFALTINHSMAWMQSHPLLPILLGLISAPLSYFAGTRLGAIEYHQDSLLVSAYIAISWAIALPILVQQSKTN